MATSIENLTAQVAKNTSVIGSAITLIKGIKKRLDDAIASGSSAALDKLSADLGTDDQALADAVSANTPVEAPISGPVGGPVVIPPTAPFPINPNSGVPFLGSDINPSTGVRFDEGLPGSPAPSSADAATRATARALAVTAKATTFTWTDAAGSVRNEAV